MLQNSVDELSGSIEIVRVVQDSGNARKAVFIGWLNCPERECAVLHVGMVGGVMILAKPLSKNTAISGVVSRGIPEGVTWFSVEFPLSSENALPQELFFSLQRCDGTLYPACLSVPQRAVEVDAVVECSGALIESLNRKQDIEYHAFVDRGVVWHLNTTNHPSFSLFFTPGTAASQFAALRSLEQSVLERMEIFLPETENSDELLSLLSGVKTYKLSDDMMSSLAKGVRDAKGNIIAIMDPRTTMLNGAWDVVQNVFTQREEAAAVVGRVIRPDGLLHEAGLNLEEDGTVSFIGSGRRADGWEYLYEHDLDIVSPVLTFFRSSVLSEIQLNSTPTLLSSYLALSHAIHDAGMSIVFHPDLMSCFICGDIETEFFVGSQVQENEDAGDDTVFVKETEVSLPRVSSSKAAALMVIGQLNQEVMQHGRLQMLISALTDNEYALTLYAMRGITCTPGQLRKDLPSTVQYVNGMESPLDRLFEHGSSYYDLVVVWQLPYLRNVFDAMHGSNVMTICDVSGREVFSESERALMRKVSTIWVDNERGANRLRSCGIDHVEVASFESGGNGKQLLSSACEVTKQLKSVPAEIIFESR